MDSFFVFDGKNSLDYGIRIESYPDRPYPERSYNSYTVPGRSGSLIYDTGAYSNVTQSYECYYKTIATAYEMQRYLTDWLLMPTGYRELEDSYSPDVYRKAIFAGPTDVSTFFGKFGKCTLDFNCLPQRFLKSGRIPISVTTKTTLINDGEEALPLIRVSGSGSGTVSIGSSVVTLSDIPEGLTIDSETQNVYAGADNKNALATIGGGFPKLGKGHTGIEFSGGVTALYNNTEVVDLMIPILYESNEKDFVTQGLGALADTISCTVTEERNGIYELEMEYPLTGEHYSDIVAGNIIFAIPSPYRDAQPFRIYKVTKPLGENVTVYANHISYDLNKIPIKPFTASSASAALAAIKNNCVISNDFEFTTDKSTSATMNIETPLTARSCLGGVDGSILDTYGGEYLWDRFTVNLKNARGTDSGVVIRYGKNLTGLTQEGDVSSLVTGIMPYWYSDGNLVTSDPQIVYADGATGQTAIPVDMTSNFESQPTAAQLKSAAQSYIKSKGIGTPDVSLSTEFLSLSQMSGYEELTLTEKCDLCDTVTIQYEAAGINTKAKIVSITTDVLLERYNSIEVGSVRANIAQTIATQQTQIDNVPTTSDLQRAVEVATNWITGGRGGYVVFHKNADGQPDEILIMNTPDITTATQVWRWNKGGLGYSSTGYNGSYSTAITQDGKIVADFITTGTMKANIIKGGTLTLGGNSNGNGVCKVLDSTGTQVVIFDQNGITINKGTISGGKINILANGSGGEGTIDMRWQYTYTIGTQVYRVYVSPREISMYTKEENGENTVMHINSDSIDIGTWTGDIGSPRATYGTFGDKNGFYSKEGYSGTFSDGNGHTIKVSMGIITSVT